MSAVVWISIVFVYVACCVLLLLVSYVIVPRIATNKQLEWRITHGEKVHVLYTVEDVETGEKYKLGDKFKVVSQMECVSVVTDKLRKIYIFERIAVLKDKPCKITYYADDCYGEEPFDYLEPAGVALGLSYAKTIYQST